MKGITPVVAIILLLLLTISLSGFSFIWFGRMGEMSTQQAQAQLESELTRSGQQIRIDAATTAAVTVRNIGNKDIPVQMISVFMRGAAVNCRTDASWTGTLAAGESKTCTVSGFRGPTPTPSQECLVRVTAPGNSDEVEC